MRQGSGDTAPARPSGSQPGGAKLPRRRLANERRRTRWVGYIGSAVLLIAAGLFLAIMIDPNPLPVSVVLTLGFLYLLFFRWMPRERAAEVTEHER